MKLLELYDLGDLTAVYSTVDGVMSLTVIPATRRGMILSEKLDLSFIKKKYSHVRTQSLFQVHLRGDAGARGFNAGLSMKNSESAYAFLPVAQERIAQPDGVSIVTRFENDRGLTGWHTLRYRDGVNALESFCRLDNGSDKTEIVEMLDSFNVSNISPFETENDTDNMVLHHMRSHWSAEGRLVSNTLTELSLEDSWSSLGSRLFRIGQTGSMPANGYLPFMALEDKKNGLTYAFSIECPCSWQMEAHHYNGSISFSGGYADYNVGHFSHELRPGESYTTYSAFLTAADGGLLAASGRLVDYYAARREFPSVEQDLPILYNEYCYTWGLPSMETLRPLMSAAARLGIDCFIADAGWYRSEEKNWESIGDWEVNPKLFPNGLSELSREVNALGMRSGIWFEFEVVSDDSAVYRELYDCLIRRDGNVVHFGDRAFLDFREPRVREHLRRKVIDQLRDGGFGYVKVDYNENIGLGADGAVSPGEGLRRHTEQVIEFFEEIKRELPGIVIEICSSGGMRHEPRFLATAGQVSFSDAHEGPEGAVIAGNLHRFMPPRQMQIWATLKKEYSLLKTGFVIGTAMLGRYCLSGNIAALTEPQNDLLSSSVAFYKSIRDIIRDGDTVFLSQEGVSSYRHLRGSQTLWRVAKDKKRAVLYAYSFDGKARRICVPGLSAYKPVDCFGGGHIELDGDTVRYARTPEKHSCKIFLLESEQA